MEFSTFFNVQPTTIKYHAIRDTLKVTCDDPYIVEVDTTERIILYIRFQQGEIVCLEKWNGEYVCSGTPFLEKSSQKLSFDKIEIYLEMYSKHKLKFI